MKTNTAVTRYKKSVESHAEVWTRIVIPKAFWDAKKAANVIRSGLLEADSVALFIPFSQADEAPAIGDVMVKGVVDLEVEGNITIKTIMENYDAFVVKSVDPKDFGSEALHHWQVGGS